MTPYQLFLILRARYKLILVTLLITVVAAAAVSFVLPPRYKASTTLVVDFKSVDPITGVVLPIQMLLASYMATELDIIQSRNVALKVVKLLRLADAPETRQQFLDSTEGRGTIEDWLADQMLAKLDVKPSRESRIIELVVTDPDPEAAARIANAFASAYIQTNLDMKVAPAKDSATWFDAQLKQARQQVEDAQGRLTKYQTEKGITSADQKLDVEVSRLSEISSQLVQVQAQAYENASRQKQLEEFTSKKRSFDSLPEVLSSPVIQELKARLSAAETRLSQASNTLGVNHPEYLRAQSEVTGVRKKLADEINTAASVIDNNLRITQSRQRELQEAVASQKARLLELNRHRDELGVLTKEVENAQRAYESASQRHAETSLESRMDQGNVVVLGRAMAPVAPVFPKIPVILALAVVVGGLLGMVFALAIELVDRRVRGIDDLVDAVGGHILGFLENTAPIAKEVERKKKKFMKRPRTLTPVQEPTLGGS
jgi:succinoglycan biosynthesis transport protein ExoP